MEEHPNEQTAFIGFFMLDSKVLGYVVVVMVRQL